MFSGSFSSRSNIMSGMLIMVLLDSSVSLIQLQTFMIIDRGLLFTSRGISLSSFPSKDMEFVEMLFGGRGGGGGLLCRLLSWLP